MYINTLQKLDVDYNIKKMKGYRFKTQKKEDWIQKDFERQIPKLDRKKIFIPNQDELFF